MAPLSNQQSSTSGMRRIVPPQEQGQVMSSMKCLCRSVTFTPDFFSSSAREPMHSVAPQAAHRQIGRGLPQYRLREMAQSRAPSSHLPNRPAFRWPGIQYTVSLVASIVGLIFSTLTNHEETARYTSGLEQRQQWGYGCVMESCRTSLR